MSCSEVLPPSALPPAAWTAAETFPALRGFVRRVLSNHGVATADLDDLAQEVFVTMHRRGCSFADPQSAKAWSFAAARRVASNHRRGRTRAELREPAWSPPELPAPDVAIERTQLLAAIQRGLAGLAADARAVLGLSAFEELPTPEVARRLGIPVDTAYSHLRRSRQRLARVVLAALALVLLALALFGGGCQAGRSDDGARVAVRHDAERELLAAARR